MIRAEIARVPKGITEPVLQKKNNTASTRRQKRTHLLPGAWQRLHVGAADDGRLFRSAVLLADVHVGVHVVGVVGDVHVRPGAAGDTAGAAALPVLARHPRPVFDCSVYSPPSRLTPSPPSFSPPPPRYFRSLIPNLLGPGLGIPVSARCRTDQRGAADDGSAIATTITTSARMTFRAINIPSTFSLSLSLASSLDFVLRRNAKLNV